MFDFLRGTIVGKTENKVTVDVGGIGFELLVSSVHSFELNSLQEIPVSLQWHQENGPSLCGFVSLLEKSLFLLLTSCSGIGPKSALQLLGQIAPDQFLATLALGDSKTLSSLNGIGPKKAEMLVIHLKEKAQKLYESSLLTSLGQPQIVHTFKKVQDTLTALNYSRAEIKQAFNALQNDEMIQTYPFDILMRKALHILAKKM
ncbi:MAG: Holliday junction branch migration protein RuvA [Candidatus Babeliaceae bacterium]